LAIGGWTIIIAIAIVMTCGLYLWRYLRARRFRKRDEARALALTNQTESPDSPLLEVPNYVAIKRQEQVNRVFAKRRYPIDIEFRELGLKLPSGQTILSDVSGKIKHGNLVAIMGPSGAGKTTFMNVLAGKVQRSSGQVVINGKNNELHAYKDIVGYVPQEDIMLRCMTVYEILLFSARTRLPDGTTKAQCTETVESIIDMLGLTDVKHSLIGDEKTRGVSGGQRKRVNIGMELAADPTVLFLDEPTSGLDSSSSEEVLGCLKDMCNLGLTIISVIHQPRYEIFTMFDQVVLLGKGGRVVYIGPSQRCLEYFERIGFSCPNLTNPPDFFLDVISGKVRHATNPDFKPPMLFQIWEEKRAEFETSGPSSSSSSTSSSSSSSDAAAAHVGDGGVTAPRVSSDQSNLASTLSAPAIQPPTHSEVPLSHIGPYRNNDFESICTPDIPSRSRVGFLLQCYLFSHRTFIQQTRMALSVAFECFIVFVAGVLLGAVYIGTTYVGPMPQQLQALCPAFIKDACALPNDMSIISLGQGFSFAIGLTTITATLRTYGPEKIVFWREASAGLSTSAYFIGKLAVEIIFLFVWPALFLAPFYSLVSPYGLLIRYYALAFALTYCFTGYGQIISATLSAEAGTILAVIISLITFMLSGANPSIQTMIEQHVYWFAQINPGKYGLEGVYVIETWQYHDIYDVMPGLIRIGYAEHGAMAFPFQSTFYNCVMVCMLEGLAARLFTLFMLLITDRQKKK
jgi:ABC-type multidrug transport system ATPase subunit